MYMEKNPEDISHQDILNVIKASNQEILDAILDALNTYASHMDVEISGLKADMQYVKGVINTQMVTKDYLDEKFFKFESKIGGHLRKEDDKINALTGILAKKKVLTKSEAKKIAHLGPSLMKA